MGNRSESREYYLTLKTNDRKRGLCQAVCKPAPVLRVGSRRSSPASSLKSPGLRPAMEHGTFRSHSRQPPGPRVWALGGADLSPIPRLGGDVTGEPCARPALPGLMPPASRAPSSSSHRRNSPRGLREPRMERDETEAKPTLAYSPPWWRTGRERETSGPVALWVRRRAFLLE